MTGQGRPGLAILLLLFPFLNPVRSFDSSASPESRSFYASLAAFQLSLAPARSSPTFAATADITGLR